MDQLVLTELVAGSVVFAGLTGAVIARRVSPGARARTFVVAATAMAIALLAGTYLLIQLVARPAAT